VGNHHTHVQPDTQPTAACAINAHTSLKASSATACTLSATQMQPSSLNALRAANRHPANISTHRWLGVLQVNWFQSPCILGSMWCISQLPERQLPYPACLKSSLLTLPSPSPHHHHLITITSSPSPHHHHLITIIITSSPSPHHHHLIAVLAGRSLSFFFFFFF